MPIFKLSNLKTKKNHPRAAIRLFFGFLAVLAVGFWANINNPVRANLADEGNVRNVKGELRISRNGAWVTFPANGTDLENDILALTGGSLGGGELAAGEVERIAAQKIEFGFQSIEDQLMSYGLTGGHLTEAERQYQSTTPVFAQ